MEAEIRRSGVTEMDVDANDEENAKPDEQIERIFEHLVALVGNRTSEKSTIWKSIMKQ